MASGATALVADDAGFVLVRTATDEAEILTLAVAPHARRRGVGSRLLAAALADAISRAAATVHLEVSAANDAARLLYAKAGFVEIGRRLRYYDDGSDALLLSRSLA